MRIPTAIVALLLFAAHLSAAPAPHVVSPPKIRPYSGIGILMLKTVADTSEPLQLYEEPAISRLGALNVGRVPSYDWIFGPAAASLPLVVTARKGEWLRVAYDDAGREAWLNPRRQAAFQPWELFFKGQDGRLLPGLQKRYYQIFQQPGKGALASLTPKQLFRIVKLENDWVLVVSGQSALGWLRWRDEDGRLLLGLGASAQNR